MKVANYEKGYPDYLKTERQWLKLGFVVKDGEEGEEFWTNQMCQHKSFYFRGDQVRPAEKEELQDRKKQLEAK